VIAYDSNTGMEKWRVNSGELKTRPNDAMEAMLPFELQNGNLCFFFQNISMPSSRQAKPQDISADTTLFVINADNGAEEANYKVSLPAMVFNQQQGPPAFSNGYAYLISFDTSMINDEKISYTLSAISMQNGMEEWSVPVMDSPQALLSVAGVFDGRIYLASLGRATVWEIR